MEYVIDSLHRIGEGAAIAHVTDVEFNLVGHFRHTGLEVVAHVVLFFLVAREDANLTDVSPEETVQYGVSEGAGTSGNKEGFVFEN